MNDKIDKPTVYQRKMRKVGYCHLCGNSIPFDAKICPYCGKNFDFD